MRKYINLIAAFAIVITLPSIVLGQFGKNKVQYIQPDWLYIQSQHFDVFYYEGGEFIAQFAADALEKDLAKLQDFFNYKIRKRIPLIVYKSHNHFQQTNVVVSYLEEGIGGVTESFKNRMVLPYEGTMGPDGAYDRYRHVLYHELVHAYVNDMIYGASVQSTVSGAIRLQLPLWFAEGLAEYMSLNWDVNTDMIIRDATINNQLASRVSPYRLGQALFKYIDDTYGRDKVGEILRKVNITKDLDRGFTSSVGIEFEKLVEQMDLALKRKYWPDIADRKVPDEVATRLTDHIKVQNIYNVAPAISPNGDKVAYISEKGGTFDVYVMSAIDGKKIKRVLEGQRAPDVEELKFLAPGLTWSPDGTRIAIAIKAGDEDGMGIIQVNNGKFTVKKFGLDGVYGADWSPNGEEIAFQGTKNGASDIYAYNIVTDRLRQITNDYFSDSSPSFSPDGSRILFVSDRKDYVDVMNLDVISADLASFGGPSNGPGENIRGISPEEFMNEHDYRTLDIYVMDSDGSDIERLTFDPYTENDPVWSPDGKHMAFTSEAVGISNIYIMDMETKESYPITNIVTGAFQLSWAKNSPKLVFTSWYNVGFDIYMIKDPLREKSTADELKNTVFFNELDGRSPRPPDNVAKAIQQEEANKPNALGDLTKYIFDDDERANAQSRFNREPSAFKDDPAKFKTDDGKFKVNKYKLKFSPDIVAGSYGYNTFFGAQGSTILQFSDMLGDHTIQVSTDLYLDLRNSNYALSYYYLPRITDYGIQVFNQVVFFNRFIQVGQFQALTSLRLRNYGARLIASRPINKFLRADFSFAMQRTTQDFLDPRFDIGDAGLNSYRTEFGLITDTALFGFWGPVQGTRANLRFAYNPPVGDADNNLSYFTMRGDYRRYLQLNKEVSIGLRLSGGFSEGEDSEAFFLGGVPNWLNREFNGNVRAGLQDIYYSYWIDALRGSDYYELIGNRYGLVNVELRFPFIRGLALGYPLPFLFTNVQGALFYDAGAAWVDGDFQMRTTEAERQADLATFGRARNFRDFRNGFGGGVRLGFLGFPLKIDVAWDNDDGKVSKPKYYFSFGVDW